MPRVFESAGRPFAAHRLSISKIASGLKCSTELIVDGDASGRELELCPVDRWS